MSELFLILHKVRGEPAFDIAQRIQIGDEEGWIIPTSGHRAYPWLTWILAEIANVNMAKNFPLEDWPDHYTCSREPSSGPAKSLGSLLSLVKKVPRLQIRRLP